MRKNIPVCSHADLEALASSISIKVDTNDTENVMNKIIIKRKLLHNILKELCM